MVSYVIGESLGGLMVFAALGFPILPGRLALMVLAVGAGYGLLSYFYFRAIKVEEVSRVMPLFEFSTIFLVAGAAVFLRERLAPGAYLGVALLVAGSVMITSRKWNDLRPGRGFWWMLLGGLAGSASAVLAKYTLQTVDPWTVFAYSRFGVALISVPAAVIGWPVFVAAVRSYGRQVIIMTALSETLTLFTSVCYVFAAAAGYITLVGAVVGTHPFFTLIFATVISIFWPKILKEKIDGQTIGKKIIAIACIFAGVVLASLS
jgi:drug/metabolite transporter (DMT)-like permease